MHTFVAMKFSRFISLTDYSALKFCYPGYMYICIMQQTSPGEYLQYPPDTIELKLQNCVKIPKSFKT